MSRAARVLRYFAPLAVGGLGAVMAAASPALASDGAAGQFVIDTDAISVTNSNGWATGTVTEFHGGGMIQAQFHGTVHRVSTGAPCVFSRVIFTYADGTTSSLDSLRACNGELSDNTIDLHSLALRDLVRYRVELRTAVDSTSVGVAVNAVTNFVNNSPDSQGTAAQLDVDSLVARKSTMTLFNGKSTYFVNAGAIRSTVTGTLTWNDIMPGAIAEVKVIWTYADGTTTTITAGSVNRGPNSVSINVTSLPGRDVRTVKVSVSSKDATASFGTQAIASAKFGDYLAP